MCPYLDQSLQLWKFSTMIGQGHKFPLWHQEWYPIWKTRTKSRDGRVPQRQLQVIWSEKKELGSGQAKTANNTLKRYLGTAFIGQIWTNNYLEAQYLAFTDGGWAIHREQLPSLETALHHFLVLKIHEWLCTSPNSSMGLTTCLRTWPVFLLSF